MKLERETKSVLGLGIFLLGPFLWLVAYYSLILAYFASIYGPMVFWGYNLSISVAAIFIVPFVIIITVGGLLYLSNT